MAERNAEEIARIMADYDAAGAKPVAVAAKHGLSERTLYRIVAKARKSGAGSADRRCHPRDVPSRTPPRARTRANKDVTTPGAAEPLERCPRLPASPDTRISYDEGRSRITELMAKGRWSAALVDDLAVEFGVSVHTVRAWAHDASVALRASVDPHKVTAYWLESIDFLAEQAYLAKEAKDTKSAILAMSRLGQLCGSMIRGATEHARPPGERLEDMSDEELLKEANSIASGVKKEDEGNE